MTSKVPNRIFGVIPVLDFIQIGFNFILLIMCCVREMM